MQGSRGAKARVLADTGFDMDLDGRDCRSIQYQNTNNSVRVTDDFMPRRRARPGLPPAGGEDGRGTQDDEGA